MVFIKHILHWYSQKGKNYAGIIEPQNKLPKQKMHISWDNLLGEESIASYLPSMFYLHMTMIWFTIHIQYLLPNALTSPRQRSQRISSCPTALPFQSFINKFLPLSYAHPILSNIFLHDLLFTILIKTCKLSCNQSIKNKKRKERKKKETEDAVVLIVSLGLILMYKFQL